MTSNNKLEFFIPDKYFKDPTEDPIIGFIRYLREQGKACEFLGFNEYPDKTLGITRWQNNYVILIDGVKYYGNIDAHIDINNFATFFVVENAEQDYMKNLLMKRTNHILDALGENM